VLPTPALPNSVVLSCWRNFWENTLGSDQRANGRPFQTKGPTTEKARLCMAEVWASGTWRRPCSAKWRWWVLWALREELCFRYLSGSLSLPMIIIIINIITTIYIDVHSTRVNQVSTSLRSGRYPCVQLLVASFFGVLLCLLLELGWGFRSLKLNSWGKLIFPAV